MIESLDFQAPAEFVPKTRYDKGKDGLHMLFKQRAGSSLLFIALLVFLMGAGPPVKRRPEGTKTFENFRSEIIEEASRGIRSQILQRTIKASELRALATRHESPWTLQADATAGVINSDQNMAKTVASSLDLRFKNRNGLEFRFENSLFQRDSSGTRVVPAQGELTIGFDVLKGGSKSPDNIAAEIIRRTATADHLDAEGRFLSQMQTIEVLLVRYFNLFCKIQDLEGARKDIIDVVKAGEVKLASKSITMKDYLTLRETSLSLEQRIQEIQLSKNLYLTQFSQVGPVAARIAKELDATNASCPDASLLQLRPKSQLNQSTDEILKGLPQVQSLEIRKEAARREVDYLRTFNRASLVPFVGTSYYLNEPSNYSRNEGIVGFRFVYNFSGPNKDLEIRSAAERARVLTAEATQNQLDLGSFVLELEATIQRDSALLSALKRSLENSRQLLKVLKVQLDLGLIDPVVTGQTYLNYTEGLLAIRDLWASSTTAELRLQQLAGAKSKSTAKVEPEGFR